MKVVFLLDNSEYVVVDPEMLQIRQIGDGQSALGISVTVPATETEPAKEGFRPFINYAVNLSIPAADPVSNLDAKRAEIKKLKKAVKAKAKAARLD